MLNLLKSFAERWAAPIIFYGGGVLLLLWGAIKIFKGLLGKTDWKEAGIGVVIAIVGVILIGFQFSGWFGLFQNLSNGIPIHG